MSSRPVSVRLLLPSVVLPALVAAADQALLKLTQQRGWSVPTTLVVLGWFVVQTGLLAYVAGKCLPNSAHWATAFRSQMTYADWWWVAWTSLTGSFLAAMLWVLRATGDRLVRRCR